MQLLKGVRASHAHSPSGPLRTHCSQEPQPTKHPGSDCRLSHRIYCVGQSFPVLMALLSGRQARKGRRVALFTFASQKVFATTTRLCH